MEDAIKQKSIRHKVERELQALEAKIEVKQSERPVSIVEESNKIVDKDRLVTEMNVSELQRHEDNSRYIISFTSQMIRTLQITIPLMISN